EAGELVVGVAGVVELFGREGDACGRALPAERLEELLGQHVLRLADALARIEGTQEMDATLAGLDQLLERGIPAGAVADQFDGVRWPVELPRWAPHELAEPQRVEGRIEALRPVGEANLGVGQVAEVQVTELAEVAEPAAVQAAGLRLQ